MAKWRVPLHLTQSEEHQLLDENEMLSLWGSLPGGGVGHLGTVQGRGPRDFAFTVDVVTESAEEAERIAPGIVTESINADRFPGWEVTHIGVAAEAD